MLCKIISVYRSCAGQSIGVVLMLLLGIIKIYCDRIYGDKTVETQEAISNKSKSLYLLDKPEWIHFNDIVGKNRTFNFTGHDMLVILHIQKTAGTAFEKHLVFDLDIETPCKCQVEKRQCSCQRYDQQNDTSFSNRTWLVSRFSTGWICGLHADWTNLNLCLQGLKGLFLTTFLRNPVYRFLSEFRHVQRGATWKGSSIHCRSNLINKCYDEKQDWSNVTLSDFMNCRNNMAINRQTKMLADWEFVGCDHKDIDHDKILLRSAKKNLMELSYFGICENQTLSQFIFEKTFNVTFKVPFKQSDDNTTKLLAQGLSHDVIEKIKTLNYLDLELYEFASDLMGHRCQALSLGCV